MPTYTKDAFKSEEINKDIRAILDPTNIKFYINNYYKRGETIYYKRGEESISGKRPHSNMCEYLIFIMYSGRASGKISMRKIEELFDKNALGIQDELIRKFKEVRDEPYKHLAIQKIKRNAIYNNGLGLKLAVREYSKDF
jgi:hypothetical protein